MAGQDDKREPAGAKRPRAASSEVGAEAAAVKAAKIVFKDPLNQQTGDDTDAGWGDSGAGRGLDWYLSQRPPHHGG